MENIQLVIKDLENFPPEDLVILLEKFCPEYLEEVAKRILSKRAQMPSLLERFRRDRWYTMNVKRGQFVGFGGSLKLTRADIPRGVNKLRIKKSDYSVVFISSSFLANSRELTHLDLSPLTIIEIGESFLLNCGHLKQLILPSLTQLHVIEDEFLRLCYSLEEIDLSTLTGVREIGDHFFSESSALTKLDLTSLTNVRKIGDYFLYNNLFRQLDLSLGNVRTIGERFLAGSEIVQLDLSSLTNVITIGPLFLGGCVSLKELDIRGTGKMNVTIGDAFLHGCVSLENIKVNEKTSRVVLIKTIEALQKLGKDSLIPPIRELYERTKPPPPPPLVPLFEYKKEGPLAEGDPNNCSNEQDLISLIEWDDEFKPTIKITFYHDTLTGSKQVVCYDKESLEMWFNNIDEVDEQEYRANVFAFWVPKEGHQLEADGHYGYPSKFTHVIKTPDNKFIYNPNEFAELFKDNSIVNYAAVVVGKKIRIGNTLGIFGVSMLHGQEPGETVYLVSKDDESSIKNTLLTQFSKALEYRLDARETEGFREYYSRKQKQRKRNAKSNLAKIKKTLEGPEGIDIIIHKFQQLLDKFPKHPVHYVRNEYVRWDI